MKEEFIDVYIYEGGFPFKKTPIVKWRLDYISKLPDHERADSFLAWRLLEESCRKSLGRELNSLNPRKLESGKIVIDDYYVSLSHSGGQYMIAISSHPVGVDVQKVRESDKVIPQSITWSEEEKKIVDQHRSWKNYKYWTRKEALYKLYDFGIPYNDETRYKINTADHKYEGIFFNGTISYEKYFFAVASELIREGVSPTFCFYPGDSEVVFDNQPSKNIKNI